VFLKGEMLMQHFLNAFFAPKSVVLFGASERTSAMGQAVYKNLVGNAFNGPIYLVNPKHSLVFGERCFANVFEIDQPIDLAVISAPPSRVNQIMKDCGKCGIKAVIILSAGFGGTGAHINKLEQKIQRTARHFGIRFIGPNCLGVIRPSSGLNTTFNYCSATEGSLALISQSGSLCTSILDWAQTRKLGFSAVVSIGSTADVHFEELLDYLIYDPQTKSILLYIEGINNARSFISAVKAASRVKPVLVMKVGRHGLSKQTAKIRTGIISGEDDVFNAVLRQAGAVRGYKVNDLFVAATVLSKDKRLKGDNLVIITNGAGPGAIAADRAIDLDLKLFTLNEKTKETLSEFLPSYWSQDNPIDIMGDASPERYKKTLSVCFNDPEINGMIIILTPQVMTEPLKVARDIAEFAKDPNKVIIACFMGGDYVSSARLLLEQNNIPTFQTPEAAIEAFSYLRSFATNQKLLMQVPEPLQKENQINPESCKGIIQKALSQNRTVLTKLESMAILNTYGISTPQAAIARDMSEAVALAASIGFPVVMKIFSEKISHKSDIGGVRLGLCNASAVKSAYQEMMISVSEMVPDIELVGVSVERMYTQQMCRELKVGLVTDPAFGPVISFGAGGATAEIMGDREMAIPPLNKTLVAELISRTKVCQMLRLFGQYPACNPAAIEQVLLAVSQMACDLPWIKELDINPLIVDEQNAIALDVKMVVKQYTKTARYQHMAIHPYPVELVKQEVLSFDEILTLRPIRPEDAKIEKDFVDGLSAQAKYFRFMQGIRTLTQEMLVRFTQIDYDLEMALIAVIEKHGHEQQIGSARYVTNMDKISCEFAIVVADDWHRKGIAYRLMQALIASATEKGLKQMQGTVLAENVPMLDFCKRLDFDIEYDQEDSSVRNVVKNLQS
jgi:acetyltransferase